MFESIFEVSVFLYTFYILYLFFYYMLLFFFFFVFFNIYENTIYASNFLESVFPFFHGISNLVRIRWYIKVCKTSFVFLHLHTLAWALLWSVSVIPAGDVITSSVKAFAYYVFRYEHSVLGSRWITTDSCAQVTPFFLTSLLCDVSSDRVIDGIFVWYLFPPLSIPTRMILDMMVLLVLTL